MKNYVTHATYYPQKNPPVSRWVIWLPNVLCTSKLSTVHCQLFTFLPSISPTYFWYRIRTSPVQSVFHARAKKHIGEVESRKELWGRKTIDLPASSERPMRVDKMHRSWLRLLEDSRILVFFLRFFHDPSRRSPRRSVSHSPKFFEPDHSVAKLDTY